MDLRKVQTIVDWATLAFVMDFECFFGFANFYQRVITHYSTIVTLRTHLTVKDQPFSQGVEGENAFQYLKASFTTAPLLIHVDLSKPFVFEMNASNFALSAILSQPRKDNLFHLVGFRSHKFSPTEINYEIHDKGFLAIMDAFEEWCHLFEGVQHEITMYSDHMNFKYFMMVHVLNRC